jgi:hypothetical protein
MLILLPVIILANPISVVSESKDVISLKFVLPEYSLTDISLNGLPFKQLQINDGVSTADEGFPELRMFSVPIAIPVDGNAAVRLTSSVQNTISDVLINPVPTMHIENDMPVYDVKRDFYAYSRAALYPMNVVELSNPAFVGDRHFVSLRIFPFQYNAASKELKVHQEMEIIVNISGDKSPSPNWQLGHSPVDAAGDAFFINNTSSKSWRLPRKQDYHHESPKGSQNQVSEIQIIVDNEGIYQVHYDLLKDFILEMTDSLQEYRPCGPPLSGIER